MAIIIKREGKNSISYQVRYRANSKQKTKSFKAYNNTTSSKIKRS